MRQIRLSGAGYVDLRIYDLSMRRPLDHGSFLAHVSRVENRDTTGDEDMYIGFADGDDDPSVQSRVCVDGHAFWLVGVGASKTTKVCEKKRSPAVIMGDTQPECTRTQPYFKKLYGWSGLDGAQWGGLTKEDIAVKYDHLAPDTLCC